MTTSGIKVAHPILAMNKSAAAAILGQVDGDAGIEGY